MHGRFGNLFCILMQVDMHFVLKTFKFIKAVSDALGTYDMVYIMLPLQAFPLVVLIFYFIRFLYASVRGANCFSVMLLTYGYVNLWSIVQCHF